MDITELWPKGVDRAVTLAYHAQFTSVALTLAYHAQFTSVARMVVL
jgi:hypothetical protein